MTTARALSVTVTLVRPYVRLFVHQYVTPLLNSFDQNFCAFSLIILFYICACCDTRFKNVCLFLFVEVKALLGLCYMLYNIRVGSESPCRAEPADPLSLFFNNIICGDFSKMNFI